MFAPTVFTLVSFQIISTIAFISAFFILGPLQWLLSILIYLILVTIGPTVTYHRLLSHRSFKAPMWFERLGSIIGCIGGISSPLAWVAIHREHHRYTDTDKDPHCPDNRFFRVQFWSMLSKPSLRYVPDLIKSKFQIRLHEWYWVLNIGIISILSFFGMGFVLTCYFVPVFLVWHGGSLVNTINHMFGYRSFETKDNSKNNLLTGYLVSGEGWHNNHHHDPKNPRFGKNWWEFDLGWQLIKIIQVD